MRTKLCLFLMISMTLLFALTGLAGCDDSSDGEAIPTGEVVDISGYTLIRGDSAEEGVVKAAIALRSSIEAKCGYTPQLSTDFVKRGNPVPTDTAEIIIGDTNRRDNIKILGSELGMYDLSITNSADFKPTVKNDKTVNYKAADKVYIGERQIFFASAPIKEGDYWLLPAGELSEFLRTEIAPTVMKDNVGYVKSNALTSYGTVKTAEDGSLVITPAYKGENLLLPDSGEISYFTEHTCYKVDLVVGEEDGEPVYELKNIADKNTGITRFITDEVRMLGAGKYKLSFDVKSESPGDLSVVYSNDKASKTNTVKAAQEWKTLAVELDVKDGDADGFVSFSIVSTSATQSQFSLKGFRLVKSEPYN